jgi:hypothetical protein
MAFLAIGLLRSAVVVGPSASIGRSATGTSRGVGMDLGMNDH